MQRGFSYNQANFSQAESYKAPGTCEPSDVNRGTKRTPQDIGGKDAEGDTDFELEPSISNKGKERAFENTVNENAEGESSKASGTGELYDVNRGTKRAWGDIANEGDETSS
jgi:hypothetical protein